MQSGGDGRRGTSARATCSMFEVPRISRRRTQAALSGRPQSKFRRGRFPQQDSTGIRKSHRKFRVGGRVPVLVILRSEGRANIFRPKQTLERVCDAKQRQLDRIRSAHLLEPRRVCERAIGSDGNEGAELWIQLLNSRNKKLRNLARPNFLLENQLAQLPRFDEWIEHRHVSSLVEWRMFVLPRAR